MNNIQKLIISYSIVKNFLNSNFYLRKKMIYGSYTLFITRHIEINVIRISIGTYSVIYCNSVPVRLQYDNKYL